eukprot:403333488
MIQVVNLKQDDYFQFLEQFAFKGQALDKNILIKSLARNDAIVFSKYSQFCFDLADFHQEISASLISVESCLHWKFFGTMLSEVLKSQAGQSQTSLFNLLPFISKAMKSEIKDFKISSYMAISQISCRRSLSTEYASAFFKQVLLSLKDQQNEEYIEKGILVISLIIQYQNIKMIDEKDVNQFLQIFRVQKLIKRMADQQDLSSLLKTIMTSTLVQTTIDLGKVYQLLISGSLNLKLAYLLIENAVSLAMQNDNLLPRCHELLNLIKTHHENDYNQALLFILKQSKESKDKIIRVISGESGNSNLIAQFGEKEYSLLSALGSQHKITKVNALQSVVENINKLTQNEKDLIILQLVTIIQSASDEENILEQVLSVYDKVVHQNHNKDKQAFDFEFETLHTFLDFNLQNKRYSIKINEKLTTMLLKLNPQAIINQQLKMILLLNQDKITNANIVPQMFRDILKSQKQQITREELIQSLVNANKNTEVKDLVLFALSNHKQFKQFHHIEKFVSLYLQKVEYSVELIKSLLQTLKTSLSSLSVNFLTQFLQTILTKLPNDVIQTAPKIFSKILGLALNLKQKDLTYNMNQIISHLITNFLNNQIQRYVEYLIQLCLETKNDLKKMFCLTNLSQLSKLRQIEPAFMVITALVCMNDQSQLVRSGAFNLASILISQGESLELLEIFKNTPKPRSAKKSFSDKQAFTPMKQKPMKSILKDLIQMKTEILTDRSQLSVGLNNSPHVKLIDQVVRSMIDLPSIKVKSKFVEVLSLLNNFSVIFSMGLQEQLNKEFLMINQNKLSQDSQDYLYQVGQLIQQVCRRQTHETIEEHISSLVFPYISLIFTLSEKKVQYNYKHEELLQNLFTKIIIKEDLLQVKPQNISELLRYYIKSQIYIYSKLIRNQIKESFVALREEQFSDKEINPILNEIIEKITSKKDVESSLANYEILLELIAQIKVENDYQNLPQILNIVKTLSNEMSQQNVFYIIELSNQVALTILENKKNSKKNLGKNLEIIVGVLDIHIDKLKNEIIQKVENQVSQTSDPFKDFIMEVDTSSKQDQKKEELQTEEFTGSFQIISSILNLLSQYEIIIRTNLTITFQIFDKLSSLVQFLTRHEKSSSAVATSLIFQLFRFYHNQVVRTCKNSQKKQQDLKLLLAQYIDTLLMLQDFVSDTTQLFGYLEKVSFTLENQYSTFIITILLCHAKDQIQVKDNIQIDSLEIQLIQRLILQTLTPLQSLQVLEELLFTVSVFKISETSNDFIKTKLKLVFNQDLVTKRMDEASWSQNRYLITSDQEVRKFKYLSVFLINSWISQNQQYQKHLSLTLHQDNKELKQTYQVFYQIYLTSSIFNEQINHLLQTKDYASDKKAKKSLKRLSSRVQEFQKNLNTLLSYEVQIDIVLRILEFKDKQTTYLKTQSLQLLISKTPQFSQGLSKVQERDLIHSFTPLILKSIKILQEFEAGSQKFNNEKQNFIHALFCLITRTFTSQLSIEMKQQILDLSFQYISLSEQFSMILTSQLILTLMTVFEVQQLDILEHLPRFITHLIRSFQRLHIEGTDQEFFEESYSKTLLKATLSLITFFSKFLTATQYEELIINVLVVASTEHNQEVIQIFDLIAKESSKNIQFKLIFQAMINSYETVIIQGGVIENKYKNNLNIIIIRFFNDLMKPIVMRMKKDFCQENHNKIYLFFKDAFELTLNYYRNNNKQELSGFGNIEQAIAESFEQFVVKLNEDQLRPIIVKLSKWAFKTINDADQAVPFNIFKTTVFYRCLNTVLNTIKEFFVPLLPLYFERTLELLISLASQQQATGKKRGRIQVDFEVELGHQQHTLFDLMKLACENIRLNFLYDNLAFIQNDSFEKLSDPLSNLVALEQLGKHYLPFIEDTLKPTIFEAVERINNDDMWKKINNELLMHTRNTNPTVRLGAFRVIENLYTKIGERYLVLLNDTIQFLSEGMEDENPDVEATARSIVQRIESITGDSIHEYLK